jgi:hypothetical protein
MTQKKDRFQTILNWLENEKKKDKIQLEKSKLDYVNQIRGLNKKELFEPQVKKLSIWQKIKVMIWGS